ncbi:MAG: pyridoxal phosphate-dependent aminotransferase [Calothrix sp. SM1_5_4]|nr:pyridoxal phosphate-dependent aminotransferase [Calothrix sp. SM1_5_4]
MKHDLAGTTPPTRFLNRRFSLPEIHDFSSKASDTSCREVKNLLARKTATTSDCISLTPGCSQALLQTLAAICNPKDKILVEKPFYEPFIAAAKFLGLHVVHFERSGVFQRDYEKIRRRAKSVDAILISNPHCPTGWMYSSIELDLISRLGAKLVVDEIYLPLFTKGELTRIHDSSGISISGLSKSTGLAAARVGWIRADSGTISGINRIALNLHVDMPLPSLRIAEMALKSWDKLLKPTLDTIDKNHGILTNFAHELNLPIVDAASTGSFVSIQTPQEFKSGRSFAKRLLEHSIWVRAGEDFGNPGTVRMHMMSEPKKFRDVIRILEKFYA